MKTTHKRTEAFTLIEIMVVLVVIGILAAAIVPQFMGTTHDAKVSTAKANVSELESALERFYVHMDRYPNNEEGLKALVEAPAGRQKVARALCKTSAGRSLGQSLPIPFTRATSYLEF